MLQITREGEYAFRAVIYLASRPVGELSRVSDIAGAADIPSSYLSKIMRRLCAAGVVRSYRGPRGGFRLARPAESITLREAIEAVEGTISSNRHLGKKGRAGRTGEFILHPVWKQAQQSFLEVLGSRTIAELSRQSQELAEKAAGKGKGRS